MYGAVRPGITGVPEPRSGVGYEKKSELLSRRPARLVPVINAAIAGAKGCENL
jgi:hypothetical protein